MSQKMLEGLYTPPRTLKGALAPAVEIAAAASASEIIRVMAASALRVRGQFSEAGILRVELVRRDQQTTIVDPPPVEVVVVADEQAVVDFPGILGESYAKITFTTDAGAGAPAEVAWVDISQSVHPWAGRPATGQLADGEAIVLDARGAVAVGVAAGTGATATVSRVDTPDAAAASGDAWDNDSVAATTRETFPVDWPFFRISAADGPVTWALI